MSDKIKIKFLNPKTEVISKAYSIDELANGRFKENGDVQDLIKLEYTKINDKNNEEIFNQDKVKINFNNVDNIAIVELFRGTFCLNFIKGNIVDVNLKKEEKYLPLSYVKDSVSNDIEIVKNISHENLSGDKLVLIVDVFDNYSEDIFDMLRLRNINKDVDFRYNFLIDDVELTFKDIKTFNIAKDVLKTIL